MSRFGLALLAALVLVGCSKDESASTPSRVVPARKVSAPVKEAIDRICQLEGSGCRVVSRRLDVSGLSAKDFQRELLACTGAVVHVWMPGERDWLLVSRCETNRTSLAEAMDLFAADTNCTTSVPEVFASYVGTREDVLPAFASNLRGDVVPEWFVTKDIPKIDWLDTAGVDEDILAPTLAEIRSMQVIRRLVLEGNMMAAKAKDKKGEDEATEKWARAALRNPTDPLLLERIDNLNRNARGFLEVGKVLQAMKCYETVVLIRPKDTAAVHNFGTCLKRIGKQDMADKVLERARQLREEMQ